MVAGCEGRWVSPSDSKARAERRRVIPVGCAVADSTATPSGGGRARRLEPWRRGLEYGLAIYGAGFALGLVRAVLVAPSIGERRAQLLEAPVVVLIGFILAGRVRDRLRACPPGALILAGSVGIAVLLALEVATGVLLRGSSVRDALVNPDPLAGSVYYAAVLLLLVLPSLRGRSRTVPKRPD